MNLQNLIDYCKGRGLPDPFSGASVPAPLNLDTVKSAIMIRCGLLTPVYGEPEVFTNMVTQWFNVKQWTFEHLINIIQSEYSPIENVNELRNERTKYGHNSTKTGGYKDTNAGKDTSQLSGNDTNQLSGIDSVNESGTDSRDISNSGTDTTTNTISAFNSSAYQPDNQSALQHGHKVDDDITYGKATQTSYGKTDITTYGKKDELTHGHTVERVYNQEKDQEGGTDELLISRHGNIGVTTNQQLINEELELLRHFDIYGFIAELFEQDNMLMIY